MDVWSLRTFEEYMDEVTISLKKPSGYVDKSDEFVKAFYAKGKKRRSGVAINTSGTSVYVELISFNSSVHITEISVPHSKQGEGVGHKVMKLLTDLADKQKVTLDLFAKPIEQGPDREQIPKAKLLDFYKKHGFVVKSQKMVREPK